MDLDFWDLGLDIGSGFRVRIRPFEFGTRIGELTVGPGGPFSKVI